MSYEGYVQLICENGHLTSEDAYYHDGTEPECSICKGKILWENQVDQTNCDEFGAITINDMIKHFRIQEEKFEKCPTCNHTHMIKPNLYRIPTREETDNLRTMIIENEWEKGPIYLKDIK